jgi:hypothetical protein
LTVWEAVKTKMNIEKKLILCSMLAIAIGIATIIPLEYVMSAEAQAAVPDVEPWFNVNISYAYADTHQSGGNDTTTWDGARIGAVANFTLTSDALKDADAQIEFYKFAVSSDQGPIVDMGYYIVEDKANIVNSLCGDGTIGFSNGLSYKGPQSNGGQGINWQAWKPDTILGFVSDYISAYNGGDMPQAVTQLRNAQTLSIDVSKVCSVTVKGNVTVTTQANGEILQHIELTKSADGFIYGSYMTGTLPIPIIPHSTDAATPSPSTVCTPIVPTNSTQP